MNFIKTLFTLTFLAFLSFNESIAQEEYTQEASVYKIGRYGKKMANGDYLSSRHRTCSHDFLPIGSLIQVTNKANGRSEVVEVNGKSQITPLELTHSVAHDLGFTGVNRTNVDILVIRRAEEKFTDNPVAKQGSKSKRNTSRGQNAVETIPVFTNPEMEKVEKKRKYEFSIDFPQHEPIKFDTTTKKVLINGKALVPKKERPVFKEKIIMN